MYLYFGFSFLLLYLDYIFGLSLYRPRTLFVMYTTISVGIYIYVFVQFVLVVCFVQVFVCNAKQREKNTFSCLPFFAATGSIETGNILPIYNRKYTSDFKSILIKKGMHRKYTSDFIKTF